MLHTGLLSITFRQLSANRIVDLTVDAGLDSIEWGGDVHVPHGNLTTARLVQCMTVDSGLFVSAYGSYYRLAEAESPPFDAVLDTAETLGASHLRVWAGKRGSKDADADYRKAVIDDARRIVELAASRSIIISIEYHNNTLTDTLDSTLDLLSAVDHPNFRTYWQPPHTPDLDAKKHGLTTLLPSVTNVHVFHWHPDTQDRFPLADGESDWKDYIDILRTSDNDHVLSLEFVRHDDKAQFKADAKTFKSWMQAQ